MAGRAHITVKLDPAALHRIENLLEQILQATTERHATMADTLDDVRTNLQELNVDVDTALNEIVNIRTELESALTGAGVDEAARGEIMAVIDGMQDRIASALNPEVPVDPGTVEPVDPNDLPHPDNTLPGDLPQ